MKEILLKVELICAPNTPDQEIAGQHKTDDTDNNDDIEPGPLNDLDDGSDGMAPTEEVIGHDE